MSFVSVLLLSMLGSGLLASCGSVPGAPSGDGEATVALSWNRDGGFAGFCDELKVTASGDVTASSCKVSGAKTGTLSAEDLKRLTDWVKTFGNVTMSSTDGGSADAMTLKLTLAGKGSAQPSDAQKQELLDWAQRIYTTTTG